MSACAKRSRLDKVHVINTPQSFSEAIYPSRSYRYYTQECIKASQELPKVKLEKDIASHNNNNNISEQMAAPTNRFDQPLPIGSIDSDSICKPRLTINAAHKQVIKKTYPPSVGTYFGCYLTSDINQYYFSQQNFDKCESNFLQSQLLNYNTFFPELSLKNAESNEKKGRLLMPHFNEIFNRNRVLDYLSLPKELEISLEKIAEFSVRSSIKPFSSAKERQLLHKLRIKTIKRPRPLQPTRRGAKVTFEHRARVNNQNKCTNDALVMNSVFNNKNRSISRTERTEDNRKKMKEVNCSYLESAMSANEVKRPRKELGKEQNKFEVKDIMCEPANREARQNCIEATSSPIAINEKNLEKFSAADDKSYDINDTDDKCDERSDGIHVRNSNKQKNNEDSDISVVDDDDDDDDDDIFSDNSDDKFTESDNSAEMTE